MTKKHLQPKTDIVDQTNPKDLIGAKKTPISLVPPAGIEGIAKAMKNGADKYGAYNWRDKKIQYTIYLDAILRHTMALIDREDIAEDSQCHHLSHIGANAAILLDAIKYDCLVDNRPLKKNVKPEITGIIFNEEPSEEIFKSIKARKKVQQEIKEDHLKSTNSTDSICTVCNYPLNSQEHKFVCCCDLDVVI